MIDEDPHPISTDIYITLQDQGIVSQNALHMAKKPILPLGHRGDNSALKLHVFVIRFRFNLFLKKCVWYKTHRHETTTDCPN